MKKFMLVIFLCICVIAGCNGPYNAKGYNAQGYNMWGYDRYGYDKNGCDFWGNCKKNVSRPSKNTVLQPGNFYCTGFAICKDGYILTAYRVIKGASEIKVEFAGKEPVAATVHKSSFINDIAVLKINEPTPHYVSFADPNTIKQGQTVYTLGYHAINILGKEIKYTNGTIASLSGIKDEASRMQVSAPVHPASSGAPLLNRSGNLIGMIISKPVVSALYWWDKEVNITWAVKVAHIIPIVHEECTAITTSKNTNMVKSVEKVKKAVCLVVITK